ncbi:unnamed protein product [Clonostachys rosea]|uniref:SUN domain-containing protein n=1 Tax=Bionectria ochroleuca TaxID=29856 RepID=A0ABY6U0C6_BIOOC|nr:unnamed protein product [Clonostachys rosea]
MRIPPTTLADEGNLGESTFEVISATDDEVLSQDENDHDLISESVSSLDARRTDDVHSLAGTEQMTDDDEDFSQVNEYTGSIYLQREEDEAIEEPVAPDFPHTDSDSDPDVESHHSTSSLEYTQQSLRAPSFGSQSQDGSEVLVYATSGQPHSLDVDKPQNDEENESDTIKGVAHRWKHLLPGTFSDEEVERMLSAVPLYLFLAIGALLLNYWVGGMQAGTGMTNHDVVVPEIATSVVSTGPTTSIAPSSSLSTTGLRPVTTELGGIDLIPMDQSPSDGWIFSSKKPDIQFKMASQNSVLAKFPEDIGNMWNLESCITLTATRDGHPVDMTTTVVKEGVISRFPRCETYGVVELALRSTCKPIVNKVVRVHFGPSMLEEVYERTKSIAQDLGELVPAAAQEAERRISDARRSWASLSDTLSASAVSISEHMTEGLHAVLDALVSSWNKLDPIQLIEQYLPPRFRRAMEGASEQLNELSDASKNLGLDLKLNLLNAQLSSKIWWLRVTGHKDEGADYQQKARRFMTEKRAAVAELKAKHRILKNEARTWADRFRQGLSRSKNHCQGGKQRPGRRGTRRCKASS